MKEAKKAQELAKQLADEELRALFNEGLSSQFGKKKSKGSADAKALGVAETNKELQELLEDLDLSDDEEELEDKEKRRTIYIDDEPTAVEVFKEKTIEDLIEEQRAKLSLEGKKGTPVTAESFAKWRAAKLVKKQADAEARVKAELSKKKGGKGLSVLSGKELFNFNAELFTDDDAAIDATEERALNEETKKSLEEEERVANEEAARAQEEQLRLAEIERRYQEELQRKHDELKYLAKNSPNIYILDGISINQIVFDNEDIEDLEPFPEEIVVEDDGEDENEIGDKEKIVGSSLIGEVAEEESNPPNNDETDDS